MLSNNEQDERKSRVAAIAGTMLFHVLTLIVLLSLAYNTYNPLPAKKGVEVNLDYAYLFKDNPEPEVAQSTISVSPIQNNPGENDIPELAEETTVTIKKETGKPTPARTRISIVETPEESTIIHRKVSADRNAKTSTSRNQAAKGKPANQSKTEGITLKPQNAVSDGTGNSISVDLGGREARILPKPTFKSSEEGKIVVSVKVNIQGMVVSAIAGAKGTTIMEASLRKQAENAARMSLFALDMDAPEEQRGTITYIVMKQK